MAHDASFLAKCEQFLLHPTVRALSLAQRVDFLENKGLSPEEITACLKNVERQNGLSRMLVDGASRVGASGAANTEIGMISSAASSSLWSLVKGYGVATAATLLLAYGYVRLRQRMVVQLVLMQRQAAMKRRQKRQMSVVETLRFVADQRKQYEQLLTRVKSRVTRLQLLESSQASEADAAVTAEQKQRERDVRALKEQVVTLKQAVLERYKGDLSQQVQDEIATNRQAQEPPDLEGIQTTPPHSVAVSKVS